jgi:hypothetical protein
VTRSEFFLAVEDEFGTRQGRSLLRDLVIGELENSTADDALARGVSPKVVWFALCEAMQVPKNRWHGAGLPAPVGDTPA